MPTTSDVLADQALSSSFRMDPEGLVRAAVKLADVRFDTPVIIAALIPTPFS
jgi:hypothetical protein